MSEQMRVGYAGVGLMGHGAAKNILLGNRNRGPVEDLLRCCAREAKSFLP